MLQAFNIHKKYDQLEILKGVDISIKPGEIVSIVGPSGSGKSTLLHILGTLDEADMGTIDIRGIRISSKLNPALIPVEWWRRGINFFADLIITCCILYGILILFNSPFLDLPLHFAALFYLGLLTWFCYYFLLEALTGRTIAKLLTGTKIISKRDGSRPGWKLVLYRSLARIFPAGMAEGISFFSSRPCGWHDDISDTLVVKNNVVYKERDKKLLSGKKLAAFRNSHIGFVFQFHHLLPEFTALENVCIPGWIAGREKKEVIIEATKLLVLMGLADRLENKPQELSGGEQQRVAVARALINNPSIIMADEPTGNLDSANALELHHLFMDLRERFQQTFLIVTHNEELAKMSDRILQMKDGRIL